jgi:hypothetical protein
LTRWYCVEIADMLRRLVAQRRGGVMSIQSEYDAVREAWTHAVLDALQAADETTRLEVARILCPAGFEIVEAGPTNGQRH